MKPKKNQYQQMQAFDNMQGYQPQFGANPYPQQGQGSQMQTMGMQPMMPMHSRVPKTALNKPPLAIPGRLKLMLVFLEASRAFG